jgi:hypothetical protein
MSTGAVATVPGRPRRSERRENFSRATEHTLLGLCPILVSLFMLAFELRHHAIATDFHLAYYPAVMRLLHGGNPYAVTHAQIAAGTAYVYPPLAAIVLVPFALLGRAPGGLVFTLFCIACAMGTLRVLNVRDWRVYGITLVWLPVYSAWQTANLTLPLALLIACVWRYRERPVVAGLLTALAITLKPFIWPLGLWLLATRRIQATAWTLAWGVAINLVTWPLVGFDRFTTFLRMTGRDTDAMWRSGYGVIAALHHLGYSRSTGEAALVIASAFLVLLTLRSGLRGRERHALALAVVLMLVASPMVWIHYFALLLVPLALTRPKLSRVWAVPLLMWVCPPTTHVHNWELVVGWLGAACLIYVLLHDRRRDGSAAPAASAVGGLTAGVSGA